jgi:hypothetical protein
MPPAGRPKVELLGYGACLVDCLRLPRDQVAHAQGCSQLCANCSACMCLRAHMPHWSWLCLGRGVSVQNTHSYFGLSIHTCSDPGSAPRAATTRTILLQNRALQWTHNAHQCGPNLATIQQKSQLCKTEKEIKGPLGRRSMQCTAAL